MKNKHAVALGKLGGKVGGAARAAKLSAKRRKEIARHAANVRWANHESRQIREGFKSYQRGEYRPVEEFMEELEHDLEAKPKRKRKQP